MEPSQYAEFIEVYRCHSAMTSALFLATALPISPLTPHLECVIERGQPQLHRNISRSLYTQIFPEYSPSA